MWNPRCKLDKVCIVRWESFTWWVYIHLGYYFLMNTSMQNRTFNLILARVMESYQAFGAFIWNNIMNLKFHRYTMMNINYSMMMNIAF